jgi:hypothetical protein
MISPPSEEIWIAKYPAGRRELNPRTAVGSQKKYLVADLATSLMRQATFYYCFSLGFFYAG